MVSQRARALDEAADMSARVVGAGDRDRGESRKGGVVAHWALQVCESELGEGSTAACSGDGDGAVALATASGWW